MGNIETSRSISEQTATSFRKINPQTLTGIKETVETTAHGLFVLQFVCVLSYLPPIPNSKEEESFSTKGLRREIVEELQTELFRTIDEYVYPNVNIIEPVTRAISARQKGTLFAEFLWEKANSVWASGHPRNTLLNWSEYAIRKAAKASKEADGKEINPKQLEMLIEDMKSKKKEDRLKIPAKLDDFVNQSSAVNSTL